MKHILFLASGNSRRFGENKLLHVLDGKPLYRHGLDMLAELAHERADCTLTVVSRYAAVRAGAETLGVRAVDSPESEQGLSYTIRAGLDALDLQDGDFIVFVVADQPYLTKETVTRLLDAAAPGVRMARVVFGERRGNPNLFCAALVPELYALRGDEGGRELLRGADCVLVQAGSERELYDVDTAQDVNG